jgi:Ni/Co efflux regulator RcnB
MKRTVILILMVFGFVLAASAQSSKPYKQDETRMTQEQRMVQQNAKRKDGGRSADVSKKVKRANKADKKARKQKAPKPPKKPKPKY